MKVERGFHLTDSYQSRCGRPVYIRPPLRSLSRGNVEDLVSMLVGVGILIDPEESVVEFSIDGDSYTASLQEYLGLKKKGSLGKYILRGNCGVGSVVLERPVEILLNDVHESYGGRVIGGEVTVEKGISGHVRLDAPERRDINQYLKRIIGKIEEWGETCREPVKGGEGLYSGSGGVFPTQLKKAIDKQVPKQ